jgi:DNA-binding CsgD family transcriptional regulator
MREGLSVVVRKRSPFSMLRAMDVSEPFALSGPERQVLELLVAGTDPAVIAQSLAISTRTVSNHVRNVAKKVDDATRAEDG